MRAVELRNREPEDLRRELQELKEELFSLDFEWQSEENPDSNRKRKIKRDIARIQTVLRELEMEKASEPEDATEDAGSVS